MSFTAVAAQNTSLNEGKHILKGRSEVWEGGQVWLYIIFNLFYLWNQYTLY